MSESKTSQLIRVLVSKLGGRVFRNQRGLHLTLDGKRKVVTGLCPGASDLIGWTTYVITPEMVGRSVAVFTAIEVKSDKGSVSEAQGDFIAAVKDAGGIGVVAMKIGRAHV